MKATVLIPNYNNEQYLVECLNSICSQSYKKFNILIIDDGSTDKSVEIIESYNDGRIKLIKKNSNSGIIDTLNIGLETIDSEYIIRMDADDIMTPDRVDVLITFMENNPDIGVCGSGIEHFGISSEKIIYESNFKQNKANLIFNHTIGHASVIYKNSILKKYKIKYTEGYNYIEDYKIFFDLSKVTSMTSVSNILYKYRREEYNNYKNLDIKKSGYLKIYNTILQELNIETSKKNCLIHYQIGTCNGFDFNFKTYKRHLTLIVKQNNKFSIYPKQELNLIVKLKKSIILYKMIDLNKISLGRGICLLFSKPKIGYYFFKTKF